ncbi:MAG: FkbM family methyltransferase [Pseudomonadota bacterium]
MFASANKRIIFKFLTLQPFNFLISRMLKYLNLKIPFFFPVKGKLKITMSPEISFCMQSDGRDSIASRLYLYGPQSFEYDSLRIFSLILNFQSVRTVLDIGANTGVYSLVASAQRPDCKVYAFEPMPGIYSRLSKNVKSNAFSNLHSHNLALSDKNGSLEFYYRPAITVPTGGSAAKSDWPDTEKVDVPCVSLDFFHEKEGLDKIDLIKIDTEMTEPVVLKGGSKVIERDKPYIICEVLDEQSSAELCNILHPMGFRFFHIVEARLCEKVSIQHDPSYQYANYLFIHPDRYLEASTGLKTYLR